MPAAQRGARRNNEAKPRVRKPASPVNTRAAKKPAPGAAPARPSLSPKVLLAAGGAVLVLGVVVMLATGDRAQRIAEGVSTGVDNRFAAMGFRLKAVHVQGASAMASPDILRASGLYKDQPLLGLDLEQVRQRVQSVGWVKEVKVVRLLPDTLVLAVKERRPTAVWQHAGRTVVIDGEGGAITEADPGRFPQLPLIVGAGADVAAPAILPAVAQRQRLTDRLEAMVRVDQRRWDLRLKDGSLVQLPAIDEEAALIQLDQLDQRQRILDLGFARIDLRDPEMIAVRPKDAPAIGQMVAGGA